MSERDPIAVKYDPFKPSLPPNKNSVSGERDASPADIDYALEQERLTAESVRAEMADTLDSGIYCTTCAGTGSHRTGAMALTPCGACAGSGCQHINSQTRDGHCALCEQDEHCLRCLNQPNPVGVREAVRQDMADNVTEEQPSYPPVIEVEIRGLPFRGPMGGDLWTAELVGVPTSGIPIYEILDDPNSVAVGRYKASLRKFLGIS